MEEKQSDCGGRGTRETARTLTLRTCEARTGWTRARKMRRGKRERKEVARTCIWVEVYLYTTYQHFREKLKYTPCRVVLGSTSPCSVAMSEDSEEFQVEDVEQVVKSSLQSSISQESRYDPETANTTSRSLLEACIKNLAALNKPFKYVVTAIIMQKNGAGLHTAMGAYWDARKDGAFASQCCHLLLPRARARLSSHPPPLPRTPSQARPRSPGRMRPCTL